MTFKEQRRCDLIAWLHRHRADFPDGFTGKAIARRAEWEEARFDGRLRLKTPEVRALDGGPIPLRAVGLPPPSCVVTYTKRIGPVRRSWEDPERVPMGLGDALSTQRFLGKLARRGVLELVPRSKPKRYVFPSTRIVFGVDPAPSDTDTAPSATP